MSESGDCPHCLDTCALVHKIREAGKMRYLQVVLKDHFFFCGVVICCNCLKKNLADKEQLTSIADGATRHTRGIDKESG